MIGWLVPGGTWCGPRRPRVLAQHGSSPAPVHKLVAAGLRVTSAGIPRSRGRGGAATTPARPHRTPSTGPRRSPRSATSRRSGAATILGGPTVIIDIAELRDHDSRAEARRGRGGPAAVRYLGYRPQRRAVAADVDDRQP